MNSIRHAYGMELRTLTYIDAVARLGTFTGAAREQHVAQPAISAQIASVERELGTSLFVRTHAGAHPTEAGRIVLDRARRIHAELQGLREDLDELQGLVRGTLRIGVTPLLGPIDMPALARASSAPTRESSCRSAPRSSPRCSRTWNAATWTSCWAPSTASQPGTWRRQSWPTSTSSSSPQKRIHQRRSAH